VKSLIMEADVSPETSVHILRTTRDYSTPEAYDSSKQCVFIGLSESLQTADTVCLR
jgi:hypothetical protein